MKHRKYLITDSRVVENTFGILASKFRIYEKPIPLNVDTAELPVKATCAGLMQALQT
jgi:hypothetical protein